MGHGVEIYVFDTGESVKIMDLAKQMIRLKGLRYSNAIDIKTIGLRLGEKIFDERLANDENIKKTHHKKIMIAKVNISDVEEKRMKIEELCALVQRANPEKVKIKIVTLIKAIFPEFKSKNSIFESLDRLKKH